MMIYRIKITSIINNMPLTGVISTTLEDELYAEDSLTSGT